MNNGQGMNENRQQGPSSYASAVKRGPKKHFWKQKQNLPRPWSQGMLLGLHYCCEDDC